MARVGLLLGRLFNCAIIGFGIGAAIGALCVLVFWFPGAMVTFAENPQYVNPAGTVIIWCAMWAVVCGLLGAVIGSFVGVMRAVLR